jgi:hypothetical protein
VDRVPDPLFLRKSGYVSLTLRHVNYSDVVNRCTLFYKGMENNNVKSHNSAVGIETGYELEDRGVVGQVPVGSRVFTFPYLPDRLRGVLSLLSSEYRVFLPRD